MQRLAACVGLALWAATAAAQPAPGGEGVARYTVAAGGIAQALDGPVGDAARGRALLATRAATQCLLCPAAPIPEERFQGNLGPPLEGVGARLTVSALRLRVVDSRRLNPASIMPAYHRVDHLHQVGRAWQGKPLLTAGQIEDVVAYLASLQ